MPQIANIVLNDGQATPVAHTFAPDKIVGTEAIHEDRSGGIAVGYPTLRINPVAAPGSPFQKVRVVLSVPTLETATGSTSGGFAPVPTVAYECKFDGTFFLPRRSSLQDRKNLRSYVQNLMANAIMTSVLETQEKIY